jgi:hypothetical protein
MSNSLMIWMCAHPLQFVTGLAVMGGILALTLIPGLNEVQRSGHPRL